MNHKFYLTILLLHLFIHYISSDDIQARSDWWKEVHTNTNINNVTDYVPSGTVRSLINSTISGNEYWHTNNGRSNNNRNETYNEIIQPDTIILPNRTGGGNTKIIRKIKRTFKSVKQQNSNQPNEESEWKENIVEPSITLDHNSPTFTTTSSPITTLQRSSTNTIQSTASDIDNLITSKVRWDDDNETLLPLSRSPIFKAKIGNQESIYEKYASIMPLPPPAQTNPTTMSSSSNENSNNNIQSSSHHSVVAPLSSSNNDFFNFNSKIVHTQSAASRSSDSTTGNNKNRRKKQTRNANGNNKVKKVKQPIQDFFLEADKIDKKVDHHVSNLKKTVDFTSRVNHEVSPKNNILAHLLKNNPFAIPLGKRTYKVTKKATTTPASPSPTILTKRMQPVRYSVGSSSASRANDEDYTTTPMSTLSNDNIDNINFKATPSEQVWGRRVQASNNLISKTSSKANQLAKRNEWSGNDEQKDSINDKLLDNVESDEESVENDENTNEDIEPITNDLNDEFNKNLAAIRNEESPKFDVVTFKTPTKPANNQVKGSLNVKSLPIQIISWRQAITHRNKGKETSEEKPFAGERLTSAKLTVSNRPAVRKEQQIERERPSPKSFSVKPPTTKASTTTSSNKQNSSFKTTASPKLSSTSTTKSAYNSATSSDTTASKRQSTNKSTRSPLNSFVQGRKNEAYIAPQIKTKPAQLFQEYEDEKESFREELDDNFVSRQVDNSSPKKENRVKYAKNQEFRKKSLNLIEEKNDNSIENSDQTEATKPIPNTSFRCTQPGYFGDIETSCTVFHICQENNRKDSFFCPPGTAFSQALSVCDWQANVNCEASVRSKPISDNAANNAFETLNNLRNNYESDDSLEEQKK